MMRERKCLIFFFLVNATKAPKSLMAAKSFNPVIQSPEEMQAWFSILSVELHSRILRNYQDFGTWPKTITIRYCSSYGGYRTKAIGSIHKDEMKTHGTRIDNDIE